MANREKQELVELASHWPTRGIKRLRAMTTLTATELSKLPACVFISTTERKVVQQSRKNAVFIGRASDLLHVRSTDIDRWAEDGRLPWAFETVITVGKRMSVRAWLLEDIDAAAKKALSWLQKDVQNKKIRLTPKVQEIMAQVEAAAKEERPSKRQALMQIDVPSGLRHAKAGGLGSRLR